MLTTNPRLLRRALTGALCVALTGAALAGGSSAEAGPGATSIEDVRVEGTAYWDAVTDLEQAREEIEWATAEIDRNEYLIEQLGSGLTQIVDGLPRLQARISAAEVVLTEAKSDLVDLAVLKYVLKGTDAELHALTSAKNGLAAVGSRSMVIDTATAGHKASLRNAVQRRDDAVSAVETASTGKIELRTRIDAANASLEHARSVLAEKSAEVPQLESVIATERRKTRVTGSDLSYVALDAYLRGARGANLTYPGCGLDWWVLAGIGRVESRHGTYAGSTLSQDGDVDGPIIGIVLDGTNGTANIADTDGGTLDGDQLFDRAVGPMQFIPATWRAFGSDGNDDGRADPQNLYDAALAAARYLCNNGTVSSDMGLRSAILTYNNSDVYVRAVLINAVRYSELGIST